MTEKSFTLSIGKKILLSFSILIFIYLGMALDTYYNMYEIDVIAEKAIPLSYQITSLQDFAISLETLERDIDKYFTVNYKENQEEVEKDIDKMNSILKSYEVNADINSIARLREMEKILSGIQENFDIIVNLEQNSTNSREINEKRYSVYQMINSERQKYRELLLETTNKIQVNVNDQKMLVSKINKELLMLGTFILVIGILLSFITSRSISRPIEKLRAATTEIGQGRFDVNIPVQSNDEVGQLASAFNKMTLELQKTTVSKDYVEDIFKSMFDMLIVATPEGTIKTVNKAICDVLGYTSEELAGQSVNILFYNEIPQSESWFSNELVKNGSIINIEKYYLAKDGRKIPVLLSISNMFDGEGNKLGVVCVARDITERKLADEALTSSLSLLNATLESTADGLLVVDQNGRITRWNQKFAHMWQIPQELLDRHSDEQALDYVITQLAHPEMFLAKVRELYGHPDASSVDQFDLSDGRIFERYSQPQRIGDNIVGRVWSFRDITQRKQAEEKIKQHEIHLMDMLDLNRLSNSTEKEVLDFTLEASLRSLQSEFAFIGIMSADESVITIRRSSNSTMKQGAVIDEPLVFPIAKSGLLGEAVRQRGPIIVNDYETSKLFKKGIPEGHAPIKRFLSIPVFSGNRIVAIAAAANKVSEYTESDITSFTSLLNEMWGILDYQGTREDIKKSLEEKEVLLREIHHRVKNNMQIVSSLLMLQSQNIEDKKYRDIFIDSQNRIQAMALIHQKLYQSENIAQINFKEYIYDIVSNIFESYGQKSNIKIDINVENIQIKIDSAIPCGLIINELVTNSLKYAFPDGRQGKIQISVKANDNNMIQLSINDNGIGIPKDLDIRNTKSLGLRLITGLAESQLHGEIILNRENGTEFQIIFRQAK